MKEALKDKIDIRVVSMPCMELFDMQVKEYFDEILPPEIEKRVFIEMGNGGLAYKYTGLKGKVIDVNSFGQTAPPGISMREYGFTSDRIVEETKFLKELTKLRYFSSIICLLIIYFFINSREIT